MSDAFDIVIVGAGSAGCVAANRLSRDPGKRVLLLEAGGWDWNPMIAVPMSASLITKRNLYNWADLSEPDPVLNGRRQEIPHGKVIGGSSSINYMAHTRGHPNDYDRWCANGATGWSYREVLPFFKQIETWEHGEDEWRGGAGELGARVPRSADPMFAAWHHAAEALNHPTTRDFNGELSEGFSPIQFTIKNGRRASSGRAFLRPVLKRRNLVVRTGATATRIVFEGKRAVAVTYTRGGRSHTVCAGERIVLCLGAINTPHLLMLSGIGPADHLRSHGIDPIADLPVGQHLEDHIGVPLSWSRNGRGEFQRLLRFDRIALAMAWAYMLGRGPAAMLPAVQMAYLKSEPGLAQPDLELLFQLPPAAASYWFPGIRPAYADGFGAKAYLIAQESLGEVVLRSPDPRDRPLIYYNSLSAPGDLPKLREGVKRILELARSPELAPFRGEMIYPKQALRTDAEIDDFIRGAATQQYHPASTCRMGAGPDAVVDPTLAVHGIDGLNIVDASVMPRLVSANPNVVVMMMAAKAASMWQ